jgi:hypothetical protein
MGGPTAGSSARDLQKLRVKKGVIVAANTVGEQNRLWRMGVGERLHSSAFAVSRQVGRLRRVCSSRMMLMKKYGEAISQERIVGNRGLKESFLHITR